MLGKYFIKENLKSSIFDAEVKDAARKLHYEPVAAARSIFRKSEYYFNTRIAALSLLGLAIYEGAQENKHAAIISGVLALAVGVDGVIKSNEADNEIAAFHANVNSGIAIQGDKNLSGFVADQIEDTAMSGTRPLPLADLIGIRELLMQDCTPEMFIASPPVTY